MPTIDTLRHLTLEFVGRLDGNERLVHADYKLAPLWRIYPRLQHVRLQFTEINCPGHAQAKDCMRAIVRGFEDRASALTIDMPGYEACYYRRW